MGVLDKLSRKTGVITGDDVLRLFQYCQEKTFAIPAIVSVMCHQLKKDILLTDILERDLVLHRCCFPRGRP